MGQKQWIQWPETTSDSSGDPSKFDTRTAFAPEEPHDWFICAFYSGFPRQNAQLGAYSMAARFGRDHTELIAGLLDDESRCRLYIIEAALKPKLRVSLRETYSIWRGTLFPDSAGAAATARTVFSSDGV